MGGVIRLGKNSNDYRLGNVGYLNAWGGWAPKDWFSPYIKINAQQWGNIDGADPDLDPNVVPTADPNRWKAYRCIIGSELLHKQRNIERADNRI